MLLGSVVVLHDPGLSCGRLAWGLGRGWPGTGRQSSRPAGVGPGHASFRRDRPAERQISEISRAHAASDAVLRCQCRRTQSGVRPDLGQSNKCTVRCEAGPARALGRISLLFNQLSKIALDL
ncbi:hypothetical protein ElyMa_001821000 [Elysia marginata]|uniref:Uncharacterized protein n=1 Tax=Elysia marginata TaxID=1093978 RepID=A0AAV4EH64_9GAST|nr:hypothetical protein ElyMa_001821000 [Elysia marginata]